MTLPRLLVVVLAAAAIATFCGVAHILDAQPATREVRVTFYLLTGTMFSGYETHWGAAACSWDIPLYSTVTFPDGHTVTCLDRGYLGSSGWVDVWVPDRRTGWWLEQQYGGWSDVTVTP